MENSAMNPNIRLYDAATEQDLKALSEQLLVAGDGTGVAPLSSDLLLQYFINDTTKLLTATPESLPGVISKIKERLEENRHEKLKPLYRIPICFLSDKLHLTQIIKQLQLTISKSLTGIQPTSLVQYDQIDYARLTIDEQNKKLEDMTAVDDPSERIDFEFEGNSVYVMNGTRDRILRYWYLHRERHVAQDCSNREIAKEMNVDLGVTIDYAAKIIGLINRWFVSPTDTTWLSGEYIQRLQMYFKSLGYSFQLNYCDRPPNTQQIIALGRQLHVHTKEHPEE